MASKHNNKEPLWSRRTFLKKMAVAGSASISSAAWAYWFYNQDPVVRSKKKLYKFKNYSVKVPDVTPALAVVRGTEPERMLRNALDLLGGIEHFIRPGDRVLIKPNAAWDRQPEQAANTNPDLVAAMVMLCREARAAEVSVTDGSINDPYRCFKRSGIEDAVLKAGGRILFPRKQDLVSTDFNGKLLKVWPVYSYYHEADKVINMPIVKHHSLSGCTLSMKNWYGTLGGERNRLHQDIHRSIVDLARRIRPTLTVMDAIRVLKSNGPNGGNLSDVIRENTIIAGLDETAMDSYALSFLELSVRDVPYLKIAEREGLGTTQWKSKGYKEIGIG